MQENVFTLIGRYVKQAKREHKKILLFFNDSQNLVTNDFLVTDQCEYWEISDDGVRPMTTPNDVDRIMRVLNADIIRQVALPYGKNCDRWNVIVQYESDDKQNQTAKTPWYETQGIHDLISSVHAQNKIERNGD